MRRSGGQPSRPAVADRSRRGACLPRGAPALRAACPLPVDDGKQLDDHSPVCADLAPARARLLDVCASARLLAFLAALSVSSQNPPPPRQRHPSPPHSPP